MAYKALNHIQHDDTTYNPGDTVPAKVAHALIEAGAGGALEHDAPAPEAPEAEKPEKPRK